MTLDRQFLKATITELLPDVWHAKLYYSYYGLYVYTESQTFNTIIKAVRYLALQRCGHDRLYIVNDQGMNIDILTDH